MSGKQIYVPASPVSDILYTDYKAARTASTNETYLLSNRLQKGTASTCWHPSFRDVYLVLYYWLAMAVTSLPFLEIITTTPSAQWAENTKLDFTSIMDFCIFRSRSIEIDSNDGHEHHDQINFLLSNITTAWNGVFYSELKKERPQRDIEMHSRRSNPQLRRQTSYLALVPKVRYITEHHLETIS